ncbi:MAG: hypothetical protein AAF497_06105 [Planctomycetota bacterium]
MTSQLERPLKSARLWIVAFAVVFVAAGCFSLHLHRRQQVAKPSNAWEAYSEERAQKVLTSGRTVLLYCRPTYHPATSLIDNVFADEQIAQVLVKLDLKLLQHTYENWEGEMIRNLFQEHGHSKSPMIFLYSPNGRTQKISTCLTVEAMRNALENS